MKRKIFYPIVVFSSIFLFFAVGFAVLEYKELSKPGIVILLFHGITVDQPKSKYEISYQEFQRQIGFLAKNGYRTVLPKEIMNGKGNIESSKTVMLSFDDGLKSHYSLVYPLLKENNLKGIFFIITNHIGKRYGLSADQILEMYQNGMEIGSHSQSHPFLDQLGDGEIYHELVYSKEVLESIIHGEIISFAPPGGWFDDRVVTISRKVGYRAFFGCEIGTNDLTKQPYVFRRIEVLGNMKLEEFEDLLNPPKILTYKINQSIEFFAHSLLGSNNYKKLRSVFPSS